MMSDPRMGTYRQFQPEAQCSLLYSAGSRSGTSPATPGEGAAGIRTERLKRIQELRSEGMGFDRIAEKLNTEGYKARTGGRWHGLVVDRILSRTAA